MVLDESRRHRLNMDETGPVYRLITERLRQLVMDHNNGANLAPLTSPKIRGEVEAEESAADTVYGESLSLFRLLWRMDHNRPGKPEYPEPFTWTLLGDYLMDHKEAGL